MDTSPSDKVKAPQHFKTPRAHLRDREVVDPADARRAARRAQRRAQVGVALRFCESGGHAERAYYHGCRAASLPLFTDKRCVLHEGRGRLGVRGAVVFLLHVGGFGAARGRLRQLTMP